MEIRKYREMIQINYFEIIPSPTTLGSVQISQLSLERRYTVDEQKGNGVVAPTLYKLKIE